MIFLGDIACPKERVESFNRDISAMDIFDGELVIVNFEAVYKTDGSTESETLYNDPQSLNSLISKARKVVVSLANNHMYDYPDEILSTKAHLERNGCGVFGVKDQCGAIRPYEYSDESGDFAFFGHCWSLFSRTNPNKINDVEIVDNDYGQFLSDVSSYVGKHPSTNVYCFIHWNYDLEKHPFPMHVRLAHDLIDAGVQGVIGSHSHVVQGVELYKGKPIAYGLGNFYLPSGVFFNGRLSYPTASKETVGVWINTKGISLIHFDTDKSSPVKLKYAEQFKSSINTKDFNQYVAFFKKYRVKNFFVPVFENYTGRSYEIKLWLAILRIKIIKTIQKLLHF